MPSQKYLITMVLCFLPALILGGAGIVVQGPLPGDVLVTKTLQLLLGSRPLWAEALSGTGRFPQALLLVVVACALGGIKSGWSGIFLPLLAYPTALVTNLVLRAVVFVPRPSDELVAIAKASADSGLPSTLALVYGCVLGVVVATPGRRTQIGSVLDLAAMLMIVIGCVARVILGGHWLSQVVASILVAFGIAFGLRLLVSATANAWRERRSVPQGS